MIFTEHQGGYIETCPSTIGYPAGHDRRVDLRAGIRPPTTPVCCRRQPNPVDYQGLRLSALWKINDDWNVLLQQNYQNMEADGYFYAYPQDSNGTALPRYQITAFTPAYNKDQYESTAWTVNGKVADLLSSCTPAATWSVTSTASRTIPTTCAASVGSYYACIGPGAGYFNPRTFPTLAGAQAAVLRAGRQLARSGATTHTRAMSCASAPTQDYRIRGLRGRLLGEVRHRRQDELQLPGHSAVRPGRPQALPLGSAGLPVGGRSGTRLPLRPTRACAPNANTAFGEDVQRGYKQTAFFASIDFDLIPKVLTVTRRHALLPLRRVRGGLGVLQREPAHSLVVNHPNGPALRRAVLRLPDQSGQERDGHALARQPDLAHHAGHHDVLHVLAGLPSGRLQPYVSLPRPAALAGRSRAPYFGSELQTTNQYEKPAGYNSDNLINNEVGFKSEFFDHHAAVQRCRRTT